MAILKLFLFVVNTLIFTWALRTDLKIAGGEPGDIVQHPWLVTIWTKELPVCTGFLIADKWVLTAGQCCIYKTQFIDGIRAGSNSSYEGGQYVKMFRFIFHPGARKIDGILVNDLAIIQLVQPVSGDNVGFIQLPAYREQIVTGTNVTVAGIGLDQNDTIGTLREITAPVLDDDQCADVVDLPFFHYTFSCAGTLESDKIATACGADSGAPVEYNNTAFGFVSYIRDGECDQTPGVPTLFVKVAEYVEWIQEITGIDIEK